MTHGPCTIVPTPPDGLTVDPQKQALDVEGNINHIDFQIYATLYFAVNQGLAVKSNSSTGAGLVKAGTAFTKQVTYDDTSIFDPNDPNFSDKAKYMNAEKCCSSQIAPDGKARAVKFQLDGSRFEDKNDYYVNYVGGYEAPAPGVPAAP